MKVIETKTTILRLGEDKIIRAEHKKEHPVVALEDAKELNHQLAELSKIEKHLVLADIRNMERVTREARKFLKISNLNFFIHAFAFFISSPINRIMVNFIFLLHKPPVPTRMFTDKNEAEKWLKGFL